MAKKNIGFELNLKEGQKIVELKFDKKLKKRFDKDFEKNHTYYLKQFLVTKKDYDIVNNALNEAVKMSLPDNVEDGCKWCKGESKDIGDKNCGKYYLQMDVTFMLASNEFIRIVSKNKHIYNDKPNLKKLTVKFYDCFRFIKGEGKMYLDLDRLCRFTLESGFLTITKMFSSSDTLTNLKIINSTLNDIEEKDLSNKINNIEDENYLDLQKMFFENKRRFYKDEIFIDEREEATKKALSRNNKKEPTVVHYALYYHYLQQSKDFGYFENHPQGKWIAIKELIKKENIKTTAKYFQIVYNRLTNYQTNRIAKKEEANISYVANTMLKDYPKAKEIALLELQQAKIKSR